MPIFQGVLIRYGTRGTTCNAKKEEIAGDNFLSGRIFDDGIYLIIII
jgi:hypothetical protein